jgi:hypothetical protein
MNAEQISNGKSSGAVVIGVAGVGQSQSMFEVAPGRSIRVEIPEKFADDHCGLAVRDTEILGELMKCYPREFSQIVNAVNAGKFKDAKKIAEQIGLTEENFISQGGGLWALVIGIAIGAALLLAHD